jgi:uncharacterized protein
MICAFLDFRESASGIIVRDCQAGRHLLCLSKPVISEYQQVLHYQEFANRGFGFAEETIDDVLARLRYLSEWYSDTGIRFHFARDPDDEKFIELAIAGRATHIITYDKDLLSLPNLHTDAAKRFRRRCGFSKIMTPETFLATLQ